MTKDELEAIRARHADCEPERCEDVHRLLAELDRHMCQCGHWMADHGPEWMFDDADSCDHCECGDFTSGVK